MGEAEDLWFGLTEVQKEGVELMISKQLVEFDRTTIEPRHRENGQKLDRINRVMGQLASAVGGIVSRHETEDRHAARGDRHNALLVASILQTIAIIVALITMLRK